MNTWSFETSNDEHKSKYAVVSLLTSHFFNKGIKLFGFKIKLKSKLYIMSNEWMFKFLIQANSLFRISLIMHLYAQSICKLI